jgi:iron complex transport system permease protein
VSVSIRSVAPLRRNGRVGFAALALGLALAAVAPLSLSSGALPIPFFEVLRTVVSFGHSASDHSQAALVVWELRLPRLVLGLMIGAALGLSGAMMQGLFRNPLADPGLVGVSAGAGLASAGAIVLGDHWTPSWLSAAALLPLAAFLGALCATTGLYLLATRRGRTSVATMLLAGVALAALAGALTGLLAYISDDRQLRDLTFWSMGSLGGASWRKAAWLAPAITGLLVAAPLLSRGLNALALGEAEAFHLGVDVQRLKMLIVFLVAVAVGASVAAAGVIGFIGLVGPQALRLAIGPDNRALLPLSAAAGALLLAGADIAARTLAAPAEIPIGVLTAVLGAPFFLALLISRSGSLV